MASDFSDIVFFGNCQSELLCALYNRYVSARNRRRACHVPNYAELTADAEALVRQAAIVVFQNMEGDYKTPWTDVRTSARILHVPLVSGRFLWPFAGQPHPANQSLPYLAYGPFGFELGNAYLSRLYLDKISAEEGLARYAGLDIRKIRNLDRGLELEMERQRLREEGTGVRLADFIEQNFRTQQLFHSPFHLALDLLKEFAVQFLPQIGAEPEDLALMQRALTPGAHRHLLHPSVYLFEPPIHPAVTRHYRLEWAPDGRKYRYFGESGLTFDEYVRRYVSFTWNADLLEGIHLSHQGRDREAAEKLGAGLARDPESAEGHYALSRVLMREGALAKAAEAARRAIELDPGDSHHFWTLSEILQRRGELDAAAAALRAALDLDPGNVEYAFRLNAAMRQLGHSAEALAMLRRTADFAPFSARLHLELARGERDAGAIEAAEKYARRAVALEPESPAANLFLGHLLGQRDRLDEAIAVTARAVDAAPEDGAAQHQLGYLMLATGNIAEAEKALTAAVRLQPTNPGFRERLAETLIRSERPDDGLAELRKAVTCDPHNPHWLGRLCLTLLNLGRFADAEAAVDEGRRSFADTPLWQELTGRIAAAKARVGQAA